MEKRLFLAILLSFLVLYGWSALTSKKQPHTPPQQVNQENLISEAEIKTKISPSTENTEATQTLPSQKFETTDIESENLKLTFSTLGGSIQKIIIKNFDAAFPLANIVDLDDSQKEFKIIKKENGIIEYIFEDEKETIHKIYKIRDNIVDLTINFNVKNRLDINEFNIYSIKMSNYESNDEAFMKDRSFFEYVINSNEGFLRKNNAFQFNPKEKQKKEADVRWIGFRDRFFCGIIKPLFSSNSFSIDPVNKEELDIKIGKKEKSGQYKFTMYFGPEDIEILNNINPEYSEIKRYYKNSLFDSIAKLIYFLMRNIHKAVHNWGISIILIGLLVYFAMYPLTLQSFSSMKKMQKIQPKINALKEKYKNNPQKMNQEMMEIYRDEKINPLGGCLPLLLQMPVFIGLYQVLWRNVSLKGSKFLWIKDLSAPDRLIIFKTNLPFIGNELNILPLLMIVVMYIQQKLSSKNMVLTDSDQIAQQKMMTIIFPIMLGFIFYKMSSGLTLYFTLFYLLSAFTQWKMSK
jgi:YidC/Oxa1 family membrane protein insertase